MSEFLGFFFAEADAFLIKEIAKEHGVDETVVRKHYKTMLENISNEVQD
jgi:hypothetical protein